MWINFHSNIVIISIYIYKRYIYKRPLKTIIGNSFSNRPWLILKDQLKKNSIYKN